MSQLAAVATAFLRLPFQFDPEALRADGDACVALSWKRHFNAADFQGSWDGIALRSPSGAADDIRAHPGMEYADTPLLEGCRYFKAVLDRFECEKESVRLLRLAPGSEIKEHSDPGAGYSSGAFRIHVPVRTNPGVRFLVGGSLVRMEPGESWYADFGLPHSVKNDGETDRIHLVIDALRNPWTDAVFREAGYDFEAEARARAYPLEVKVQMLERLRSMDSAAARELVAQLTAEIEAEQGRPPRPPLAE